MGTGPGTVAPARSPAAASTRLPVFLLLLLVFAVYIQTVHHGFLIMDDVEMVVDNPHIAHGITADSLRWAWTANLTFRSTHLDYWQPATNLSRLLDVQMYGFDPAGHHFTNVLLHAGNVLLLFGLLFRTTRRLAPSFLAAALFAVHPVHVASVAWVVERKDVLSLFFGLAAMHLHVSHERTRRLSAYGASLALFALSLMSKPMTITLPILLLLVSWWPCRAGSLSIPESELRGMLLRMIPYGLLGAASVAITLVGQPGALEGAGPLLRGENAVVACAAYVGRLFLPRNLACFYPFPLHLYPAPIVAVSAMFLILVTVAAVAAIRSRPCVLMGWLWFLVGLIPTLFTTHEADANRFLYLPAIGIYVIITYLIEDTVACFPPTRLFFLAAAAVVLCLAAEAAEETGRWSDSETLLRRALQVTDDNYFAHRLLGTSMGARGDYTGALAHLREALRIRPGDAITWNNMGWVEEKKGDLDAAESDFRRALEINPGQANALMHLGEMRLLKRNDAVEALAIAERLLATNPDDENGRYLHAACLMRLGRFIDAAAEYEALLPIYPDRRRIIRRMAECRLLAGQSSAWLALARSADGAALDDPRFLEPYVASLVEHLLWVAPGTARSRIREAADEAIRDGARPLGEALVRALSASPSRIRSSS